jgi:membrane protease YdiL (CAAX protease family)
MTNPPPATTKPVPGLTHQDTGRALEPEPRLTHPAPRPPSTHPVPEHVPRFTNPVPRRVPRWGSVADPGRGSSALSTASPPTALLGWVVVTGGIAFLLARPALGGTAMAVPLLAAGYLVLGAAAVAVGTTGGERGARAPLGWMVVLGIGLAGVAGAVVVGGPVADRRVGVVAGGLALVAAVAEEALFRRVLYDRLLRFGVVGAVAGTAVVFALVHLPAYGVAAMPVDLGAALLLSWQRYASGRWTVPAVTHAVANLLAVT